MIDARNYDTTEELEAAMKHEYNIAKKQCIDEAITKLKMEIISFKGALQRLQDESDDLKRAIDEYYKTVRENRINVNVNSS